MIVTAVGRQQSDSIMIIQINEIPYTNIMNIFDRILYALKENSEICCNHTQSVHI